MDYQISSIGTWWVLVRNSRFPSLVLFSPLIIFGEDIIQFNQYMFQVGWSHQPFLPKMGFSEFPPFCNHSNSFKAAQLWLLSPINLSFSSRSLRRRNGARERVGVEKRELTLLEKRAVKGDTILKRSQRFWTWNRMESVLDRFDGDVEN